MATSTMMKSCSSSTALLSLQKQATRSFTLLRNNTSRRSFSDGGGGAAAADGAAADPNSPEFSDYKHAQDFVKIKLEPGEWDADKTDPIYTPPFKSNARIISAEDFNNRPMVGRGEEFASLSDAMITLCWLSQKDCDNVYQMYLDMMTGMAKKQADGSGGVTSHEYVTRVIAQKFTISATRVAAIIQLAHNEDQVRKEGGVLHYGLANWVEQRINDHIKNAYDAYRETPPTGFVEDPVGSGIAGVDPSANRGVFGDGYERVEDLYDIDELTKNMIVREKDEARIHIDNHVYTEDEDEWKRPVHVDGNCKKLIKTSSKYDEENNHERREQFRPPPEMGKEESRERYKFVAQVIDTRKVKKQSKNKWTKTASFRKANKTKIQGDTLVEHNGSLRVATVAEVKAVPWKPVRDEKEFIFGNVKQGWIDRVVHGKSGTWGRFKETREVDVNELNDDFGVADMFSKPMRMTKEEDAKDDANEEGDKDGKDDGEAKTDAEASSDEQGDGDKKD